jgi:uncharacterized protein
MSIRSRLLAASLLLVLPLAAHAAEPAKRVEAARLLESMDLQSTLDASISLTLDGELRSKPELEPFREVMLAFFRKYMSYESLKPDLIVIYEEAFTEEELAAIRVYQESEVGRKATRLVPQLMQRGGELGQRKVQEHISELKKMFEDEAARIKANKAKSGG